MSNRAVLYLADAPALPSFGSRPDQRPALLAELFPALWWFCCFAGEDVLPVEVDATNGSGQPVRIRCLGLRSPVEQALARCERRLLSSSALLAPGLIEVRERFLDFLRAQHGRWIHLDLSEIEPLCLPEATGDEALAYHLRMADTTERAEALIYAQRHGLQVEDGLIRETSRVEHLMGYEEIGPEERTMSREYIPRFDPIEPPARAAVPPPPGGEPHGLLATPSSLIEAVRVVSLALVGFDERERERILDLSRGAIAAMTEPTWANCRDQFTADGQARLLLLPGVREETWPDFRRLLTRHAHELHAMTIRGEDVRSIDQDTPLRAADGAAQRLSLGYDGIGFTAEDLAADPLTLRFDPVAVASPRRFTSLLSFMAHLARKLQVEVRCVHASAPDTPFLVCTAEGRGRALPRR